MFFDRLNALARMAAQRSDVIVVAFMLMAIVMMIIPLPTWLVDTLIGLNISLSILILIVAFYIKHSVEFSALPPLILLSTLFRLSLSITTTRLILLDGNAGHIVKAFGDFVIAGQVVVGLVVFLIITVAQFVVITKGAERVAEVAARFTLDAMPGKQMSIDNDLRNGDIDQHEARRRRSRLERESQMFGAMDGAMKFVKGDAIASLVILAVNLLGGMMIGMVERNMSFADAAHTYSLLTVGDGLIAQIPALLISVAAGMVVTRVNSGTTEGNLGSEILHQLGYSAQALGLTALILLGVALLPGFPALVFIGLSALLGVAAFTIYRRDKAPQPEVAEGASEVAVLADEPIEQYATLAKPLDCRVLLSIGLEVAQVAPELPLRQRIDALCHELRGDLGIEVPVPDIYIDRNLPANGFVVELEGVSIRNQRALLEAMVEWGAREPDAARLADHLRASLARQISHQYADRNRVITAFVLTPAVEEQLRAYLRRADNPRELLNEHASRSLLTQLRTVCGHLAEGNRSVLLVHPDLRRSLRRLVVRGELELAVLSFRELAGEYNLQAIGSISLTEITDRRTAGGASLTSMATA